MEQKALPLLVLDSPDENRIGILELFQPVSMTLEEAKKFIEDLKNSRKKGKRKNNTNTKGGDDTPPNDNIDIIQTKKPHTAPRTKLPKKPKKKYKTKKSEEEPIWFKKFVDTRFNQLEINVAILLEWKVSMDKWRSEVDEWRFKMDEWRMKMDEWRFNFDKWRSEVDEWRFNFDKWRNEIDEWRMKMDEWKNKVSEKINI